MPIHVDPSVRAGEYEWILHVAHDLEQEGEDADVQIPVSIFTAPKNLLAIHKESYVPQIVAIGPYHHRHPELYEMERYKLTSAKRTQNYLACSGLKDVVERFMEMEECIRASYHSYLDFDGETLAWLFAIDAAFLLDYLEICFVRVKNGASLTRISSKLLHLVDCTGRKSAHQAIIRDVIKLENQVPLFILTEFLIFHQAERDHAKYLAELIKGLLSHISPLELTDNFPSTDADFRARSHLLELLYHNLVPTFKSSSGISLGTLSILSTQEEIVEFGSGGDENINGEKKEKEEKQEERGCCGRLFFSAGQCFWKINKIPVCCFKRIVTSKKLLLVVKLPWEIIRVLVNVHGAKAIEKLFKSAEEVTVDVETEYDEQALGAEDIAVPTVTELSEAGVSFCPAEGGLGSIAFKKSSGVFYLPAIRVNENSEVVLRNLVAFEASVAPEVMAFTRYVDLMNELICKEEDVRILRKAKVLRNYLKSDREVSTMWHGISKSVKTTKVPFIDSAIRGVNAYYSATWSYKTSHFMKKYVFGSWPFLAFLAANLLILLTALQTFCSVYKCSRLTSDL